MTKRNAVTFTAICDALCVDPSLTRACKINGVNVASAFRWLRDCVDHPELYTFEYGEYGVLTFSEAVRLAQKIQNTLLISEMRSRARFGFREQVVFGGKLQYADNPKFVGWTDDEMTALGFDPRRDRILFDKSGLPVPLTVQRQPSDQLQIAVAKVYGGDEWRAADRREIDVRHSGGVMVVGQNRAPTPRTLPAPATAKVIEQVTEEIVAEEIAKEEAITAAEEATDAELIPEIAPPVEEAEPAPAPEVSADLDPVSVREADRDDVKPDPRTAAYAAYAPQLAALDKKLADVKAKAAAAPAPVGRYITRAERGIVDPKRDSSDEDNIGRGTVKPGGTRVA